MVESKIVEAVGTAGGAGGIRKGELAKRLEKAMSDAVVKCQQAGISDPDKIREAQHDEP